MTLRIGLALVLLAMTLTGAAEAAQVSSPGIPSAAPPRPHAPDEYVVPNWADLLRTMVRFHALDLDDSNVLDGFSAVTECDLHKLFYRDDFRWNEVKKTIRDSSEMHIEDYPVHYLYESTVQMGRYDFGSKTFLFSDKSMLRKVNVFKLLDVTDPHEQRCGDYQAENIPFLFKAHSDIPLTVLGLPIAPSDAESLLRQMDADTNSDRIVYVTFKMTVTYIDKEKKKGSATSTREQKMIYYQSNEGDPRLVMFDVRVDLINFYEDKDKTKLIYSYNPYPP